MKEYLKKAMEVVYVLLAGFLLAIILGVDWVALI